MSIRVALHHKTVYKYDRLIELGPQIVRLKPAPHTRTPIISYSLRIRPAKHFLNWQQDPVGNYLARVVFPEQTRSLELEVDLVAELPVINPFDFFLEPHAEQFPFAYEPELQSQLTPYLRKDKPDQRFAAFCKDIDRQPRPTTDFLVHLNQKVHNHLKYILRYDPGVQTAAQTLELGWCRSCATKDWRRGSYRATRSNWSQIRNHSMVPRAWPSTPSTFMHGPRSTCPAPDGSGSMQPAA